MGRISFLDHLDCWQSYFSLAKGLKFHLLAVGLGTGVLFNFFVELVSLAFGSFSSEPIVEGRVLPKHQASASSAAAS